MGSAPSLTLGRPWMFAFVAASVFPAFVLVPVRLSVSALPVCLVFVLVLVFVLMGILVLSFMKSLTFVYGIITLFTAESGRMAIHIMI